MNIGKIFSAGTALILAAALSGCSVRVGTNSSDNSSSLDSSSLDPSSSVTESDSGDSGKTPPKDPGYIVAEPQGDFGDEMKITYGDFDREYKFALNGAEIEDDTEESVAEQCKTQRETIINYLVNERIILKKAGELGVKTLTEEEMNSAEEQFNAEVEEQVKYYAGKADFGDRDESTITDDERRERGEKDFDKYLESCGLIRDDLLVWAVNSIITNKLIAEIGKSVEYSAAEESFKDYEEKIKQLYTDNIAEYEQGGFTQVWVPEGSRMIKHILLGFDTEIQTELEAKRSAGDDEEADKLREEKAAELQSKIDEVQRKLDDGEDFKTLMMEYSNDAAGSSMYPDGYVVVPDGIIFMDEFQEAAFEMEKIGDRTVCVTDYGVHIMIYADDAKVDPNNVKEFTDYLYDQLIQSKFSEKMEEWKTEYNYRIDYEALRLDAPESTGE